MIRPFILEDIHYVIASHMDIYGTEYGFDLSFRDYIEETTRHFVQTFDPAKENLWIAEVNEQSVGTIAIVNIDSTTAQLRWFLLEPQFRGIGLGRQLLETAITFARECGYRTLRLWTSNLLETARYLYLRYGFAIVEQTEQILSGITLIEEIWELNLESLDNTV
ncbi:GNAT family N-acetyltransferase [Brevibacillus ginsengisoli]|uniref:GNAT family N-acetyltransferase n=1 Tax=Brevibacillus ginsengisoli TaxID=363854 RepID=UPI003CF04FB9